MKKKIIRLLCFLLFAEQLHAQSFQFPSDYFFAQAQYQKLSDSVRQNQLSSFQFQYAVLKNEAGRDAQLFQNTRFLNWVFNKNFIAVADSNEGFKLVINPITDFRYFKSNANTVNQTLYLNARGIVAECTFGKKLFLHTSFIENQAFLPNYLDSTYKQYKTSIGEGRYKSFKINGYDYASAQAYIGYQILPQLHLQVGTGKNKIGFGYRSIWLSDMAFNYPYLKLGVQDKNRKLNYHVLYALLSNLSNGGARTPASTEPLFQKKAASFQHLEWRIHRRFYTEFFQGIVWQAADTNNRIRLPINYINPILYTHAASYGLNNKNNVYLGLGWHARLFKNAHVYNYLTIDDLDIKNEKRQKTALQIGLKLFHAFGIQNLFLQSEYNRISPFTFDGRYNNTSISHYNQPLAYGLQSNSQEWLQMLRYNIGRWFIEGQISVMKAIKAYTYDASVFLTTKNYFEFLNSEGGFNPLVANNQNTIPIYSKIPSMFSKSRTFIDLKFGFVINPKYLMTLQAGLTYRKSDNFIGSTTERIIYFGLSTRLYQRYWDN